VVRGHQSPFVWRSVAINYAVSFMMLEAAHFEIGVDGQAFVGEFLFIEILNLSLTGPALPLAFSAAPDDQTLDVVFLYAKERSAMEAWLTQHPEGTPPPLTVIRGRKINFKWQQGHLRIDSRVYLPPKKPASIQIRLSKKSVTFIVLLPCSNWLKPS
jgi:diacylglycerol kinase family enzyme